MIANGNKYYICGKVIVNNKRMKYLTIPVVALCLSGSVNFESSARTPLIQQEMQQEDQNDEHAHIAKYKDLVKRENKNLLLKTTNGKDVVLKNTDNPEDAENYATYFFEDYLKSIDAYLVMIQYYEGEEYCLISKKTGEQIIVPGQILLSPDKKRFISYNMDLEAGYSPNGFAIYLIKDNTFENEFELYSEEWGPSKVKWINNNEIEIERTVWSDNELIKDGNARCLFENSEWVCEE